MVMKLKSLKDTLYYVINLLGDNKVYDMSIERIGLFNRVSLDDITIEHLPTGLVKYIISVVVSEE